MLCAATNPDMAKCSSHECALRYQSDLSKDGEVFIRAERIPDAGTLGGSEVTIAAQYPVVNNEVRLHLPEFGAWDAYTIVIGRSADRVTTAEPQ